MLINCGKLSLATYNVLFEILIEQMSPEICFDSQKYPTTADSSSNDLRLENPAMIKVIAQLLSQSSDCEEILKVKRIFLEDLLRLCEISKENRRYLKFFKFNSIIFSNKKFF